MTRRVFAENLFTSPWSAFLQHRLGNGRELRCISMPYGMLAPSKSEPSPTWSTAGTFTAWSNVLDDFLRNPHRGSFPARVFTRNAIAFDQLAAFVVPATLHHFRADGFFDLWIGLSALRELLLRNPT